MKKVLFLISSLHIGGAQKSLVLLANALARRGYDITIRILVNKTDLQSELDERIKVEYKPYKMHLGKKIPYIRHEFYDTGLWENRTAAKNLYRYYVGDDKFDVEIAFSAGIVQKTIEGSTNSDAVHIAWEHSDYSGESGFRANLNARQLFDSFSLLDYVVCVTKNAAESYKKAVVDTGNVVTINNIIPVDDIRKKAEEKPAVQVKKAGFHMVVASRIEDKTKGIFRIVEVVSKLKSEGCDVSLAIVGKGISATRDKAMEYIDTPLTAYADGDDYFEPEYLQHLIEGYEKHGADLVISGVNYHAGEDLHRTDRHKSWGNRLITRESFDEELPRLLWDRHLNYLYSKLFKSELLKPLRVGKNVNQGSDTMFVIQYLKNADSIEMVDHADYHYVRYKSRSVTSTKGIDSFNRLIRLNRYLQEYCIENGMMTELMQHMIDGRILLLTKSLTNQAVYMELPKEERIRMIDHMLTNGHYLEAYNRQKERNTLNYDGFTPDKPMSGEEYFNHWASERERMKRKAKILDKTPNVIKNIYRKLK